MQINKKSVTWSGFSRCYILDLINPTLLFLTFKRWSSQHVSDEKEMTNRLVNNQSQPTPHKLAKKHFRRATILKFWLGTAITQKLHSPTYSSRHQIAIFKATEGSTPPPLFRTALSHQWSVARFATLLVLSCIHSPVLWSSCGNVVRFWRHLQACNFIAATGIQ